MVGGCYGFRVGGRGRGRRGGRGDGVFFRDSFFFAFGNVVVFGWWERRLLTLDVKVTMFRFFCFFGEVFFRFKVVFLVFEVLYLLAVEVVFSAFFFN